MSSWSNSTLKRYATPINRWFQYCSLHHIDPFKANYVQAVEFLSDMFHERNLGYSTMNTARCALSVMLPTSNGTSFGKHPLVTRLLKGIFRLRPSLPRYTVTYDVGILLNYMSSRPPNRENSLEEHTCKLATLMCLLSAQRAQTLGSLTLENMHLDTNRCIFYVAELMKQSRPSFHPAPLEFTSFPDNQNICVVECINDYLERTKELRKEGHRGGFFISYATPHKPIISRSISRYVCKFLGMAGIDTKTFTGHSTRSASTSAAARAGLSLSEINRAAGWSNARTFQKHYNVVVQENFGLVVNSNCK